MLMLIILIQYKRCACETANQVQCSITMMSSCYSSVSSVLSVLSEIHSLLLLFPFIMHIDLLEAMRDPVDPTQLLEAMRDPIDPTQLLSSGRHCCMHADRLLCSTGHLPGRLRVSHD